MLYIVAFERKNRDILQSITNQCKALPLNIVQSLNTPRYMGVEPGRAKKKTCVSSTPRKDELGDKTILPPPAPPPPPLQFADTRVINVCPISVIASCLFSFLRLASVWLFSNSGSSYLFPPPILQRQIHKRRTKL